MGGMIRPTDIKGAGSLSTDLVQQAVATLVHDIASGTFGAGSALPPESDLARHLGVSRPTMREAVKVLASRGVLRVVHGRGTFVQPQSEWTDLPTLVHAQSRDLSPRVLGLKLTEIRRMIEVGASGLAATHRTAEDLIAMKTQLDRFDQADETADVTRIVAADLGFHNAILAASGNPFIGAVLQPIAGELLVSRTETSKDPDIRSRAQRHHKRIYAAIMAGDVPKAKNAMRAHMTQTKHDIESYLEP